MKRFIVLTISAVFITSGILLAVAGVPLGSPVPRTINYDGTLERNGEVANGPHDFRFQLVDQAGSQIWPQSGYADRNVEIVGGKFQVRFPESGEAALSDEAFETKPLYLKIFVKTQDDSVFYELLPAVELNAVPFAVRAERAVAVDVLPPGAIIPFYGVNAPYGWLIADGSIVDARESDAGCTGDYCGEYLSSLVEHLRALNISQGQPNLEDPNQATLPDLRGVFLRGQDLGSDNNPDASSDDTVGKYQADVFRSHNHGGGNHHHNMDGWQYRPWFGNTGGTGVLLNEPGAVTQISSSGSVINSEGGSETRPKNVTVLHIIKW